MVVFATPGMLHAGQSLEIFKAWCDDEKNLVILPGYCVAGTVGNRVLAGQKQIRVDRLTTIDVNCKVSKVSFSAHADSKGDFVQRRIGMCRALTPPPAQAYYS